MTDAQRPHLEEVLPEFKDWTLDPVTHRTNSSTAFIDLVTAIKDLLEDQLLSIASGPSSRHAAARNIAGQLAHVHGLVPLDVLPQHVREDLAARGIVAVAP